ncbi:efflux RND transporter permease subunit [Microbulbifer sp. ZKSA006]|uniref:efflux RND transporter permease subunit n=1 Tax=Microbulbifer sp. ZKSA006 TaxID=3243390 RepID=UPI00403A3EA2
MAFTDKFIKYPILAFVFNILILVAGVIAATQLPLREYPALESTTISVSTDYPGASAEMMQGFVTTPIAQAIASASDVEYIHSDTVQGRSTINARLKLNANSHQSMTEIMAKIDEVRFRIPKEATDPVIIKTKGNAISIMYIGFGSEDMSTPEITDYIERSILPRLTSVEGIGSLGLAGDQTLSVRVWLDPVRIAAYGLSASDVAQVLRQNNVQAASGKITSQFITTYINVDTSVDSLDDFREMVVKSDGNNLVRVKDIATVEFGAKNLDQSARQNGRPVVFVAVNASPTGNPLEVIADVKTTLESMEKDFPQGLTSEIAFDVSRFISASIEQVIETLLEAIAIVVLVMYLFLGSIRSILIPLVTIPLSIVGAALLMWICGFSINLLTLLAMVLAIGLVVDDSIVVVENVFRHIEAGESPIRASLFGAREIVRPVIAMTITLAAVFAPIGFLGGLTGSLFREFAFALAAAVLVSGIVALTLSPMMASYTLKPFTSRTWFAQFVDRQFFSLKNGYRSALTKVLHYRFIVLILAFMISVAPVYMYRNSQHELSPVEDQATILTAMKGPQHVNIDYTESFSKRLEEKFRQVPESNGTFIINGPNVNEAFGGMTFTPWERRERKASDIQQQLQMDVSDIEGQQVFIFPLPTLPASTGGMPVQMVVSSSLSEQTIHDTVEALKDAAINSGLFMILDSNLSIDKPVMLLDVDRDKANKLGIRMQNISDTLAIYINENYINRINIGGRTYEVIPQVAEKYRLTPSSFDDFYLNTDSGVQVPLSSVISIRETAEPNKLYQFNQLNSATLGAIPAPGVSMGEAVGFLQRYADSSFPDGFSYDWLGDSRQFVKEGNEIMIMFALAILVIYLTLAVQFESLRDPIVIMMSVPLSLFGALIPIYFGYTTINIYTQIGLVTLIGLISKHGILIVEFANQLQNNEKLSPKESIIEASSVRLRPILMTTTAMVVGLLPLVTASGAGAESRFALGVVIVVGMLFGTLFTLFAVPAFYTLVASDHSQSEMIERNLALEGA